MEHLPPRNGPPGIDFRRRESCQGKMALGSLTVTGNNSLVEAGNMLSVGTDKAQGVLKIEAGATVHQTDPNGAVLVGKGGQKGTVTVKGNLTVDGALTVGSVGSFE